MKDDLLIAAALVLFFFWAYSMLDRARLNRRGWKWNLVAAFVGAIVFFALARYIKK